MNVNALIEKKMIIFCLLSMLFLDYSLGVIYYNVCLSNSNGT